MDIEAFVINIHNVRNWPQERSLKEWGRMEEDSEANAPRDNRGPPDSPLRFAIYQWMACEDALEERSGRFEEKMLSTGQKSREMKDEEKQHIRDEISKGFGALGILGAPDIKKPKGRLNRGSFTNNDSTKDITGPNLLQ